MGKVINKVRSYIKSNLKSSFSQSHYAKNYILLSNARSGILIGIITACLELLLLFTALSKLLNPSPDFTTSWLLKYCFSYLTLLAITILMLVYCIRYIQGDKINKNFGKGIEYLYILAVLAFGLYISFISKNVRAQVFVFVTMEMLALCIITIHPLKATILLTISFFAYLYLQNKVKPLSFSLKLNSLTCYLAFIIVIINNHHQRRLEAQKDENLEKLNIYLQKKSQIDELTGLSNMNHFRKYASQILLDERIDISRLSFVFMNIGNFANYNEKYGFSAGNGFLRKAGKIISEEFPDCVVARFSDDHFVTLYDGDNLKEIIKIIRKRIRAEEHSVHLAFKAGIYTPLDRFESPSSACDHARFAADKLRKKFGQDISVFDDKMYKELQEKQYIINNIDNAIQNKYIKVYYQPVVWAKNGKLCGAEALARWDDPKLGFLSPAAFVPILEEYHMIYKLDSYVMEMVCRDLNYAQENNLPVIPISINFSRLDFEFDDPVRELNETCKKYHIQKDKIHVEITESALSENDRKISEAMEEFHSQGYSLWLDDFGSGYSGLNVLKDFNFDMMKIDMTFLSKFTENKKTQPILASVVSLAQKIGMQTLSEGVETQEMMNYLKSIGCQRLQGYLFGKPMPKEEFLEKIINGTFDASDLSA